MFSLSDIGADHNCAGFSRRDFLRVGALGGMTLPGLLANKAVAAEAGLHLRDKCVVLLFLSGGPPHIEFFDPKMTAPSEFRSITGEVKTNIPGVTFGGTFPKLAKMTDKFSVVRSFASRNNGHKYDPVTVAGNPLKASLSALYTKVAGTNHPDTGMPRNTLVLPEAIDPKLKLNSNFETQALPTLTQAGDVGRSYAAFNPAGGGDVNADMRLQIPTARFTDRRGLLGSFDSLRRDIDASGALESADKYQQQAFDTIARGVADAFNWQKEDPRTIERYDTRSLFDQKKLQRYHDMKRASNLLGLQMLMARRLCEAGCGFVTVSDCGWDYHANNNSPKNMTGIYPMGNQVDHAVSAFLEDVHQRGLSEKILLVVTGEMGRTPRINKNGGRDHYGNLTSLLVAGGGLKMGQVIGESDKHATEPATRPYDPRHLRSTIMHTLFDIGQLRVTGGIPNSLMDVITGGSPIPELV
ncbi:MAG: hypothetical protein CMO78_06120 [Verrucomicrobiales bacterium]|nr:hypothetical protein [Verrucomicrobiales bacterium]HCU87808.1 DUF1501 domain-containing protein [Verrucomicrobiales bacterium]